MMNRAPRRLVAAATLLLLASATARAASLPKYLPLPTAAHVQSDNVTVEDFGQAEFAQRGSDEPVVQKGKHWSATLVVSGLAESAAAASVWALLRPSLVGGGWTVALEADANPYTATLRYQRAGKDAWLGVAIYGADDVRLELVEVQAAASTFTLAPPAAKPERVSAESGDFPYLAPLPGSTRGSSRRDDGPLLVVLPGSDEPQAIGSGSIGKSYQSPAGLSNLQFTTTYHQALVAAGWTIVSEAQGVHLSDATLLARYAKHGRDLWALLHDGGDEYELRVVEAGAEDLAKTLARECHVALYGVFFDFNKATLKPESTPTLERVAATLVATPSLTVEVQGHTDNVGGDDYNQKLSDARARAVVAWLTAHKVPASRLTARGYGRTRPVASNDTDAGRAKNRRVEIAREGCGK